MSMEEFAELKIKGESYQLPVITGSEDEKAIDIKIRKTRLKKKY